MAIVERERTSAEIVMYAMYLYFLGLSFKNTSRTLEPFLERSHVAVWQWVQRFDPKQVYPCKRIAAFLIDETQLQIVSSEAWLWAAIEPIHTVVLGVYISRHRNMLVVEAFLKSLIEIYGRHIVYSDGGTWYPEAFSSLSLEHRLHSSYEKSLIERVVECLKDRTEGFDDCYACMKEECELEHVFNWTGLLVFMYNDVRAHIKFGLLTHLMDYDNDGIMTDSL
jgi:putative transposase